MLSDSCAYQAECRGNCGQIMSPSYPLNFPPGLTCHWTIYAPKRHYIRIEIDDFDIPSSSINCKENSLTLIHDKGQGNYSYPEDYKLGRKLITY